MGNRSRGQSVQRRQPSAIVTQSVEAYSGPLPSPEMLEKYNTAFPECAERIVALAERQAAHRQKIEEMVVSNGVRNESRAPIFGFIIAVLTIVSGTFLAYSGKETTGLAAIISALVALAGVFVYGKHRQYRERSEKNPDTPQNPR